MVMFVDNDNNPLHEIPVQLTARGCFQFKFDKQLSLFSSYMVDAYNNDQKKNATTMKNYWHSMCVFAPRFQSLMRGGGNKVKPALQQDTKYPTVFWNFLWEDVMILLINFG
jgi:hypothetical protein